MIAGGVQQVNGKYGGYNSTTSFGPATDVQFALDLYRIEAVNSAPGQVGSGATLRQGTYEGTITLNSSGQVSFVPEPSTYALFGSAALVLGFVAVRRRKLAAKQS